MECFCWGIVVTIYGSATIKIVYNNNNNNINYYNYKKLIFSSRRKKIRESVERAAGVVGRN